MRAERDQDEYRPYRKAEKQPRLAYEIALGIIIGGVVLWTMDAITSYIAAKMMLGEIQVHLGR